MLRILQRLLTTPRGALGLLLIYALALALATVVEKYFGSEVARQLVYFSPLLIALQALIACSIVGLTLTRWPQFARRPAYLVLHFAFLVVLAGAAITHFSSKEGFMHLREGQASTHILDAAYDTIGALPFAVELQRFRMQRYPGSNSPSSYESHVVIIQDGHRAQACISMNNVLDCQGYRFFQSSFDPDERGTVLMVVRDELGRRVTYIGYGLLLLGVLLQLFDRRGRLRRLISALRRLRAVPLLLLFLLASPPGLWAAREPSPPSLSEHLARISELPVQLRTGRLAPYSTWASMVVRKLTREAEFMGMHPVELVDRMLSDPLPWLDSGVILVGNSELGHRFGLRGEYVSLRMLFPDDGSYLLHTAVEEVYQKDPLHRTLLDKDLLRLDERANTLRRLLSYELLPLFPDPVDSLGLRWFAPGEDLAGLDSASRGLIHQLWSDYLRGARQGYQTGDWSEAQHALEGMLAFQRVSAQASHIDPERIRAEAAYNRWNLDSRARLIYLIGSLLLLMWAGLRASRRLGNLPFLRYVRWGLVLGVGIGAGFQLVALVLRWYVGGYAPWSNSYETMLSLAFFIVLVGLAFDRMNPLILSLSSLLAGVVLFVSGLSWLDPQITPLVPVLQSPWLMFHVAILMLAYGCLGLASLLGGANLVLQGMAKRGFTPVGRTVAQLNLQIELLLLLGLALMVVGVFLGAIWANESWGRYWSWDPKETWALVTILVYALILHWRWFLGKGHHLAFSLMSQVAILVVLMTYFGVNYLLTGMHSYGSAGALASLPWWLFVLAGLYFVLPVLFARAGIQHRKKSSLRP